MRIVQVTPSYAPCIGGAERLLQAVSERLVTRGHSVTVLTFDCATQRDFSAPNGAGLPTDESLNGVRVLRLNPSGGGLQRLHQWWLRRPGGWRSTTWLMGEDFEFQFGRPSGIGTILPLLRAATDVIASVNWHFGVAYWALQSSRLRGLPHVAVPILHIERPWAQRELYAPMLRRCAAAIVCTEAEREFVRARGQDQVAIGGCGVDPGRFRDQDGAAIRAHYSLGDRPIVGFVGRQDESKGVVTLLEAMREVWRHRDDTILLLAGPRAHRNDVVSDTLASLPPAQRANVVSIDDFPDRELASILSACDLLAQPSLEEAFGLVLVEAWMCERPVIGADIAATRSLIEPGLDGWLVRPSDPLELAAKILNLLSSPERRARFGKAGRAKVLARYTWDRVTDVWEATFRQVLGQAAARSP
jgi:glycosyltransferase involved in cell wall biosynthesis